MDIQKNQFPKIMGFRIKLAWRLTKIKSSLGLIYMWKCIVVCAWARLGFACLIIHFIGVIDFIWKHTRLLRLNSEVAPIHAWHSKCVIARPKSILFNDWWLLQVLKISCNFVKFSKGVLRVNHVFLVTGNKCFLTLQSYEWTWRNRISVSIVHPRRYTHLYHS